MRFKNIWHILLILLMFRPYVNAEENRTEIMVDFRVNVAYIDPNFSDNKSKIDKIVEYINSISSDSTLTITSVSFCGAASPEGPYDWNRYLAGARLASLEKLIRSKVNIPDSIISRDDSYIPWNYLREQVANSNHKYKDAVISIIVEAPELVKDPNNGKLVDRRILRLKRLDNRHVWNELFRLYFSKMRNASAVIITYKGDKTQIIPVPDFEPALSNLSIDVSPQIIPAKREQRTPAKPFYMAVYSNMLYDALAIPNIGLEFYLGKNFSIAGNWMHAWWSYDRRHRYWRIYGGELNARYWFGKAARNKPLTGHHAGIYAQALTYDFEFGGKAQMGGEPGGTIFDRAHFGAGIEYGYSLPVAKRLNIDFTIGVGYIGGRVYEFVPDADRYLWTATKNRHWFGPTKLEVSLVWLIGRGNVNTKKGGAR